MNLERDKVLGDLATAVAGRLLSAAGRGRVAVVCERPTTLAEAVERVWARRTRKRQIERGGTDDVQEVLTLTKIIVQMQLMKFEARPDTIESDVVFCTHEQFLANYGVGARVLLITTPTTDEGLRLLSSCLPDNALVVSFGGQP